MNAAVRYRAECLLVQGSRDRRFRHSVESFFGFPRTAFAGAQAELRQFQIALTRFRVQPKLQSVRQFLRRTIWQARAWFAVRALFLRSSSAQLLHWDRRRLQMKIVRPARAVALLR